MCELRETPEDDEILIAEVREHLQDEGLSLAEFFLYILDRLDKAERAEFSRLIRELAIDEAPNPTPEDMIAVANLARTLVHGEPS